MHQVICEQLYQHSLYWKHSLIITLFFVSWNNIKSLLNHTPFFLSIINIHILWYILWFNFILGSNFNFLCFKLIVIHYNTQKQKKRKFEPRIKLNHNIYIELSMNNYINIHCYWELSIFIYISHSLYTS